MVSVTNDATINTFGVTENSSRSKVIRPRGTNVFMAPDTNAKLPARALCVQRWFAGEFPQPHCLPCGTVVLQLMCL